MRKTFCTITTHSHLVQVLALHASLLPWLEGIDFVVLVTDVDAPVPEVDGIRWLDPHDLADMPHARDIQKKYRGDRLRWSLKPVLLRKMLAEGYEQAIYLDNDLFFYADPGFLFDELRGAHLLLSPHWRTLDPAVDRQEFENHFTDGLYNAGFLGAATGAEAALKWWARACLHRCQKDIAHGYFDDQRYLDLLPVYFPPAKVLGHPGCNVAYWNRRALPRVMVDGELRIRGEWPIVFIHFTSSLITEIVETGREAALRPYLDRYLDTLRRFDPQPGPPSVKGQGLWQKLMDLLRAP